MPVVRIEITDSRFTNSSLILIHRIHVIQLNLHVVIKDTIIENLSDLQSPFIYLDSKTHNCSGLLNITLQNLNVRDNNSSFLCLVTCVKSSITFTGCNFFTGNKRLIDNYIGGEIHFSRTEVYISRNIAKVGSPISVQFCTIEFEHSHVVISNNEDLFGGVIVTEHTRMIFNDNTTILFSNNIGTNGGALSMDSNSSLIFNATALNILVNFTNNAAQRGGAIYVNDSKHSSHDVLLSVSA